MTKNVCTATPDCDRAVLAKGLCNAHYLQQKRGEPFRKPRKAAATYRNADGLKSCHRCDTWKPESAFGLDRKTSDGLSSLCRGCVRLQNLFNKYRITEAQYLALLDQQNGCCAVCGYKPAEDENLHVDHDHECCSDRATSCGKCVRGLLCNGCNLGIGHMADDPSRLRAAAQYLERGSASA